MIKELLARKIELGIVGAKLTNPRVQFTPFVEDELILAVPRDTAGGSGQPLPLKNCMTNRSS